MESARSTQELLEMMMRDRKNNEKVSPRLPEWMINRFTNPQVEAVCQATFVKLDAGTRDPAAAAYGLVP